MLEDLPVVVVDQVHMEMMVDHVLVDLKVEIIIKVLVAVELAAAVMAVLLQMELVAQVLLTRIKVKIIRGMLAAAVVAKVLKHLLIKELHQILQAVAAEQEVLIVTHQLV